MSEKRTQNELKTNSILSVKSGENREQGIGIREQRTESLFGDSCRVRHVRGSEVGKSFGRHSRRRQDVAWDGQKTNVATSKMNEQSGNVYENKGPLWKTRRLSWDVYENKIT